MWLVSVALAVIIAISALYTTIRGHPMLRSAKTANELREAREWVVEKCAGIAVLGIVLVCVLLIRVCADMSVYIEYDEDHVFYEYDKVDEAVFKVVIYPLFFPIHNAYYLSFDTSVYNSSDISIKAEGMMPKKVHLDRYVPVERLDWKYKENDFIIKGDKVDDEFLSCDVVYSNGFINKDHSVHLVDIEYKDDGTAVLDLTLNGVSCKWRAEVLPRGER